MRPGLEVGTVIVESKLGILRDRVLVGGREIAVHRGRHGWRLVAGARGGLGRVQYDGWRDRLTIQSPSGSLEIRFRWRNTMFPWRGRVYRVGSMLAMRVTRFRCGVRWSHEADVRFVLRCEEHSQALDSAELGRF